MQYNEYQLRDGLSKIPVCNELNEKKQGAH